GTNLDVTANGAGLGVGGHTGAVKITLNTASARIAGNATTNVTPSISIKLVTPGASTPANTPSPDTMIIPAVANADGINAHFQSDVRVANTSAQLIKYQLTFIPSGDSGITKGAQTTFSIEPGRTIALDDILRSFFGTGTSNAVGVLQIKPLTPTSSSTSSAAFGPLANLVSFASSRTFNVTPNETGRVTPAALGSTGNTKWVIPGVADIRSGFADWQSDVRVFNAGTEPVDVTASFYSQSGGEPKVQTLTLAAGEVKQLDKILPSFFGVTNDGGALHLSTAKASRIVATARTYNQTSKGT